jgi:two-component system, OmpR family, sensor histidine kinase ArlS
MKIRTRLALLFTLITASILWAFAFIVYYSAKENREREFFSLLRKEAITKANLFLNAKVETQTLQNIYKNNREILNEVEVAIYTTDFQLLYHDAVDIDFVKETAEMIKDIYRNKAIKFYQEDWQVIGFLYTYQNRDYIITAAALDQYGYNKLNNLSKDMMAVFVASVLFIYLAGLYFSKRAFDPIKEMTEKAKSISATNLDLRLNSKESKDELSELANTFNEMLSRLESSFDAQKQFVSNISHELRTPLAAIIAELDLAAGKEMKAAAYKATLENALSDAKKIVKLTNSLLDFAKASYDPAEISFKKIRVDEILLDAWQQIKQANPDYKINLSFAQEFDLDSNPNDHQITTLGNEYLLKVAFANLLENGCKFSKNQTCSVSIGLNQTKKTNESSLLRLLFTDQGIGISEEDLPNIFTPFYRGKNNQFAEGNGIGLSLTQKIILLHQGSIEVQSKPDQGTTFSVELKTVG